MRVGKKTVIILGIALFIFTITLIKFNDTSNVHPIVKFDKGDSGSPIPNGIIDIPPELKNVVESLSSLEQELNETNGNDLDKQIKKADVMIEKMDNLISNKK